MTKSFINDKRKNFYISEIKHLNNRVRYRKFARKQEDGMKHCFMFRNIPSSAVCFKKSNAKKMIAGLTANQLSSMEKKIIFFRKGMYYKHIWNVFVDKLLFYSLIELTLNQLSCILLLSFYIVLCRASDIARLT